MSKSVLLIGLKSSAVNFEKWPELTSEKLENAFASILSDLTEAGFHASWCLTESDASLASQQVSNQLKKHSPNIVVIGAGVRKDPDHLLMFEQILNIVMSEAPGCKLAFNTLPFDTVDAVKRWT